MRICGRVQDAGCCDVSSSCHFRYETFFSLRLAEQQADDVERVSFRDRGACVCGFLHLCLRAFTGRRSVSRSGPLRPRLEVGPSTHALSWCISKVDSLKKRDSTRFRIEAVSHSRHCSDSSVILHSADLFFQCGSGSSRGKQPD